MKSGWSLSTLNKNVVPDLCIPRPNSWGSLRLSETGRGCPPKSQQLACDGFRLPRGSCRWKEKLGFVNAVWRRHDTSHRAKFVIFSRGRTCGGWWRIFGWWVCDTGVGGFARVDATYLWVAGSVSGQCGGCV